MNVYLIKSSLLIYILIYFLPSLQALWDYKSGFCIFMNSRIVKMHFANWTTEVLFSPKGRLFMKISEPTISHLLLSWHLVNLNENNCLLLISSMHILDKLSPRTICFPFKFFNAIWIYYILIFVLGFWLVIISGLLISLVWREDVTRLDKRFLTPALESVIRVNIINLREKATSYQVKKCI